MKLKKDIVIIGGARDYHVVDWYRVIKKSLKNRNVILLTDLISSEGYINIIDQNDRIERLFIIDHLLFNKQSRVGNIWRNLIKLIMIPIQVYYLKKYFYNNPHSIFHAQPMYYMLLCWLANIKFIGTPQGDEILIRPHQSKLYKYFAVKSLQAAEKVTVDSFSMQQHIYQMSGIQAIIVRKGIDTNYLLKIPHNSNRTKITSIRGMTQLYRIKELLEARNSTNINLGINFIYPFYEEEYIAEILPLLTIHDKNLGRLNKNDMYQLLSETLLTISIPSSDSSPRSVYEAIFAGSCVAVTQNDFIKALPPCMQERLYIVDLHNSNWLSEALEFAEIKTIHPYLPTKKALEMFNQDYALNYAIEQLY